MLSARIAFRRLAPVFLVVLAGGGCASPDDTPVEWRYRIDLPLAKGRFNLGRMIESVLPPKAEVIGPIAAGGSADTLKIRITDSSLGAFALQPDALRPDRMDRTIGSMTLTTPDTVSHVFGIPGGGILPRAMDTSLDAAEEKPLKGIRSIGCDTASGLMTVRIENRSSAVLSAFRLTLSGSGRPIADTVVGNLGPSEVRLLPVAMAGVRLDSSVDIRIRTRAVMAQGTEVLEGSGIRVAFSLNGLELARAQAMDTLLAFSKLYEQRFRISDTFDLAYIQLSTRLAFSIYLGSRISLRSSAEWVDLWDGDYCESLRLSEWKDLAEARSLDSAAYRGKIAALTLHGGTGTGDGFTSSFDNLRLFPRSDTLAGRPASLAVIRFRFSPLQEGHWVGFDRADSIVFTIEPREVRFAGFDARLRQPLLRNAGETRVPVAYPWEKERNGGLRGKVGFSAADFRIDGLIRMPDGCSIDSLSLAIAMGTGDHAVAADTLSGDFAGLSNGSLAGISKDLSRMLNELPGDIWFRPEVRIPRGTRLLWHPRGAATPYEDSLRIKWDFRLDLPLAWTVSDTARLVLRDSFVVDEALARAQRKMDVEKVNLLLSIVNPTGFGMELTGLGAPRKGRDRLFALADTSIAPASAKRDPESEWLSLVGPKPISIATSGNSGPFSIRLEKEDYLRMLAKTGYCFLWRVTLLPGTEVAIKAGDSLGIAAFLRLDGLASMDTLLAARR